MFGVRVDVRAYYFCKWPLVQASPTRPINLRQGNFRIYSVKWAKTLTLVSLTTDIKGASTSSFTAAISSHNEDPPSYAENRRYPGRSFPTCTSEVQILQPTTVKHTFTHDIHFARHRIL